MRNLIFNIKILGADRRYYFMSGLGFTIIGIIFLLNGLTWGRWSCQHPLPCSTPIVKNIDDYYIDRFHPLGWIGLIACLIGAALLTKVIIPKDWKIWQKSAASIFSVFIFLALMSFPLEPSGELIGRMAFTSIMILIIPEAALKILTNSENGTVTYTINAALIVSGLLLSIKGIRWIYSSCWGHLGCDYYESYRSCLGWLGVGLYVTGVTCLVKRLVPKKWQFGSRLFLTVGLIIIFVVIFEACNSAYKAAYEPVISR